MKALTRGRLKSARCVAITIAFYCAAPSASSFAAFLTNTAIGPVLYSDAGVLLSVPSVPDQPVDVAFDSVTGLAYATNGNQIYQLPVGAGQPRQVLSSVGPVNALAVHGGVFLIGTPTGGVFYSDSGVSLGTSFVPDRVVDVAFDSVTGFAYASNGSQIYRLPVGGQPHQVLSSVSPADRLAVHGGVILIGSATGGVFYTDAGVFLGTSPVSDQAVDVAFDDATGLAYSANGFQIYRLSPGNQAQPIFGATSRIEDLAVLSAAIVPEPLTAFTGILGLCILALARSTPFPVRARARRSLSD